MASLQTSRFQSTLTVDTMECLRDARLLDCSETRFRLMPAVAWDEARTVPSVTLRFRLTASHYAEVAPQLTTLLHSRCVRRWQLVVDEETRWPTFHGYLVRLEVLWHEPEAWDVTLEVMLA